VRPRPTGAWPRCRGPLVLRRKRRCSARDPRASWRSSSAIHEKAMNRGIVRAAVPAASATEPPGGADALFIRRGRG
jgi:hypothetical protein